MSRFNPLSVFNIGLMLENRKETSLDSDDA